MTDKPSPSTNTNTQTESKPFWRRIMDYKESYRRGRIERAQRRGPMWEWIEMILTVLVMVFVIRLVIVEAFRIPTGSMEDTMLVGDFLLVNKFIYGISSPDWVGIPFTRIGFFVPHFRLPSFKEPKSGDIVVFRYPRDPHLSYIKRCIATEGQTVEIHEKKIFIDGVLLEDPLHSKFVHDIIYPQGYRDQHIVPDNMEMRNRDNYGPIVVPPGKLFMMGDNRDNSADSRYWGFLDRELVIGEALIIYFSWDAKQPLSRLNRLIRWERIGNIIR
ncbi:MAG: signal peptidase I [Candidatus Electryoneaceae bacterium]|nr:signal peptidase I [Candidatus Electryoneaceae bacterium]